jgi:hypothetical protein
MMRNELSLVVSVVLLAAVGACSSPRATRCGNGRVCPANTRCDVANDRCIGPLEEQACDGHEQEDACDVGGVPGRCDHGACRLLFCGDGERTGIEQCDGADLGKATCSSLGYYGQAGAGLACKPDCTFDESACTGKCGDGVINGPSGAERCDGKDLGGADCQTLGYYAAAGLACSASCTFDLTACKGTCGDGVVDGTEACDGAPPAGKSCVDYGFDRGLLACSNLCGPALEGCRSFGWSLLSPAKQPVSRVWAAGPDDVFAIDESGHSVVHWDGARWSLMSTGVEEPARLLALWGSRPDDLYVAGQSKGVGVIRRWNGKLWSSFGPDLTVPDGVFSPGGSYVADVWGTGPDDLFAVGGFIGPFAMRWNGTSWSKSWFPGLDPFPAFGRIWGSGSDDVYAVGGRGTIHWDGKDWAELSAPSTWKLLDVAGSGPGDVLATGLVIDGGPPTPVVARLEGTTWVPAPVGTSVTPSGLWAGEQSDVFMLGAKAAPADPSSLTFRWNGRSWDKLPLKAPGKLTFGATFPGGVIAAVGDGTLARWDYTNWSADGVMADGVWSSGPNEAVAVGAGGIFHWDGTGWFAMATTKPLVQKMAATWGTSPGDVWAVGESGTILHGDGTRWSAPAPGVPSVFLRAVWGASPTAVFVVGDGGTILRFDGQAWTAAAIPSGSASGLAGVWGSSAADVYAVGSNAAGQGVILHFDGAAWSLAYSSPAPLRSVWGSGPRDIYVGGDAGTLLHGDGVTWTKMVSRSTQAIFAVSGSGAADVFAAADDGLFHLRAGAWEEIALPSANRLRGLSVAPSRVFVVGTTPETHLDRNVSCVGPERICNDGWDNDCDGRADAADAACAGKVAEVCGNLADDDHDGKADCDDADCAVFPACKKR